jgi:D-beta-D-heptose 7-phosphate kinase/D-beta-D-heptose 1-phosphate adenosyltransferase
MDTPARYFESAFTFLEAFPVWAPEHRRGRLGFTNGCFDLLHPGHVAYLEEVRELCDFLVIGLNSDASVARLKGPSRPVQDEAARARVLLALRSVDAVVRFAEDTPQLLIKDLQPDILAKGGDYTPSSVVGRDIVEARGGRLVLLPFREGNSTSRIVSRIRSSRGVTLE